MSSMSLYLLYTALKLLLQKTLSSSTQTSPATLLLTLCKALATPIICSLMRRMSSARLLLWNVEPPCLWSAGESWRAGKLTKGHLPVGYQHKDLFPYATDWLLFFTFPNTKCG